MGQVVDVLNGIIWSQALIALCLGAGLYLSVCTRFMQLRGLPEMLRLMVSGGKSEAGVSPFQALAMSLSGRVGIGNLAGVATAITFGGPGAVFWMWMSALLGASTSYVECTLAQIYKEKDGAGRYRGGPAYYIEKALGQKWYARAFALSTVIATGLLLPGVQANGIAVSVEQAWAVPPQVSAVAVALAVCAVIFGGVKRIAAFAEVVVPIMALSYVGMALVITVIKIDQLPAILGLIVKSAFGTEAAFGAVLGLAVEWGVKRGVYSNEAGQGTGPHSAAAAETSHPATQGYVQAFSIYIDTLVVCSATAFMILATGKYNVNHPDGSTIVANVPGVETGPAYTQEAIEAVLPGFGASFVALALTSFAFTTIIAYYYLAETNLEYLSRNRAPAWLTLTLKLAIMGAVAYGAVRSAELAWGLGDLGVGLMAWLNIVAVLLLHKPALRAFRDYEAQRRAGVAEPVFDPEALGIANADFWLRSDEHEVAAPESERPSALQPKPAAE